MTKTNDAYNWTTNRSYYNKLRKRVLESTGEIRCSYCGYNKGENSTNEWYGGHSKDSIKFPSWKMTNKVKKQWMKKSYEVETKTRIGVHPIWRTYYEVKY